MAETTASTQPSVQPPEPSARWQGYSVVFLILAVFTALEVVTAYLNGLPIPLRVGLLVFLAVVKVILVLLYFMHLRFDQRLFALPFALGMVLAIPLILIITLEMSPTQTQVGTNTVVTAPNLVYVTERSYKIDLSADHVPAGLVTFRINNQATDMMHEFIVIKTDKPSDQLPTNELGRVKEDSVNILASREDIFFGTTVELPIDLQPGHYVLICNLPEHYEAGMAVDFTVEGPENAPTSAATAAATGSATTEATAAATEAATGSATTQTTPSTPSGAPASVATAQGSG